MNGYFMQIRFDSKNKKFGINKIPDYFCPDDDKETYKANQETVLSRGRCLIVLCAKIIEAFPDPGGFFVF
jgi:hypothetical protein